MEGPGLLAVAVGTSNRGNGELCLSTFPPQCMKLRSERRAGIFDPDNATPVGEMARRGGLCFPWCCGQNEMLIN